MPRADDGLATAMQAALDAALQGHRGANPLVGAALLDEQGQLIATGYHRGAGTAHAERNVLETARDAGFTAFDSATLLTTLEPCTHQGRQPACTDVITEYGVGHLVTGAADPSSHGGGAALLAQRGVTVRTGVLQEQATELNARWNLAQQQQRPFTTVHLAQTLDGRIAAPDGTSQWITSTESRSHTHQIRERVDAILVGTRTVAVDNPRLNARNNDGEPTATQPLRVVMGLTETPAQAALTQGAAEGTGWTQLRTRDPLAATQSLQAMTHEGFGIGHVLVEGGQSILSSFFAADLVDEVFAYIAPSILGAGRSAVADIGVTTLQKALQFAPDPTDGGSLRRSGADVLLHLRPLDRRGGAPPLETDSPSAVLYPTDSQEES